MLKHKVASIHPVKKELSKAFVTHCSLEPFDAAGAERTCDFVCACICVFVCAYHVADLHVAVTEDNGVGGVPHWEHNPK